jgi:hypothetical protein
LTPKANAPSRSYEKLDPETAPSAAPAVHGNSFEAVYAKGNRSFEILEKLDPDVRILKGRL